MSLVHSGVTAGYLLSTRAIILPGNFRLMQPMIFLLQKSLAGYRATEFRQNGLAISFKINGVDFNLELVGRHNMENALAATTVAAMAGVASENCRRRIKAL